MTTRKPLDSTVLRFLLVGVVNTLTGCGLMFALYNLAGCSYWLSSAANYIAGGVVSFFLNKYFTFRNKERSWRQAGRFILTVAVCWLLAYGAAKPLSARLLSNCLPKLQENAAMLTGMCLFTALNFMGQRFFVFKRSRTYEM